MFTVRGHQFNKDSFNLCLLEGGCREESRWEVLQGTMETAQGMTLREEGSLGMKGQGLGAMVWGGMEGGDTSVFGLAR